MSSDELPSKATIITTITESYESRKYREILSDLQSIDQSFLKYSFDTPKSVKHNLFLTTFYSDSICNPKMLTKSLLSLIPDHFGNQNPTDYDEDISFPALENPSMIMGHYTIYYNLALINYCNKNYFSASKVLELLFKQTEMPEYLLVKTCYLLLDSYLALSKQHCNVLQKANNVITFLEKTFPSYLKKGADNKKVSHNPNSNSSNHNNDDTLQAPTVDPNQFKYLLHLYKAKIHLYNKSVNQSKREIKCCMSGGGNQNPTSMFIKSNLEYLRLNYSKSIKLLNALQTHHANLDSQFNFSLRSNLSALYYNNMGCIHFQLKKYQLAAYYFARSLRQNELIYYQQQPQSPPHSSPNNNSNNSNNNSGNGNINNSNNNMIDDKSRAVNLRNYSKDKKIEILYNNGLLQLINGKPELAFECFQAAALTYYKNPRLWLRLAECCVAYHCRNAEKLKEHVNLTSAPYELNGVVRFVVNSNLRSHSNHNNSVSYIENSPSSSPLNIILSDKPFGTISLEYAEVCLRSCLFLCRKLINSFSSNNNNNNNSNNNVVPNSNSQNNNGGSNNNIGGGLNNSQLTKDEIDTIRQAALANLAFVSLATNNPMITLSCTKNLIPSKPGTNHTYSVFAHMYAAEAHCMLGSPSEALRHLSTSLQVEDILNNSLSPYTSQAVARYSLLHNLTVTHILTEDLNQAQYCLSQALSQCPSSCIPHAILLQVYLELHNGNTMTAFELLRRGRTVSPVTILNPASPPPNVA